MNSQDFTYWLKGYTESTNNKRPSKQEWDQIVKHLQMVFVTDKEIEECVTS